MSEVKYQTKDAQEIHEISKALPGLLDTVVDKVPALFRGLIQTVFSEQAGRDLGKAVAGFYQELKASGMPDSMVNEIMREYLRVQGSMLGRVTKSGLDLSEMKPGRQEAAKRPEEE